MLMWNNKVLNRAMNSLRTRQRYQHQIHEFLNSTKQQKKFVDDFLLESAKEGH